MVGLDPPMFVVTTFVGGDPAGCLIAFATQCSIDPPRFLVCLSDKNRTTRLATEGEALAVHVLGPDGIELARLFGEETTDEVDKFARCRWQPGPAGLPILDGCGRWFAGWILDRFPLGDHVGFVLDVFEAASDGSGGEFGFQQARGLEPGHDA